MIPIPFSAGMLMVLLGWGIFRLSACKKAGEWRWKNEAKQLFFLINLLVIVRFTFYPFSKVDGNMQPLLFDPATAYPFRMNLIPLVHILDYESRSDLLLNLIGNAGMFVPTGIMTPLIYKKINGLKKTVLFGAAMSLVIEVIQLPFAVRASDVDDLILNTLGVLLGYGILSLVRWIYRCICKK